MERANAGKERKKEKIIIWNLSEYDSWTLNIFLNEYAFNLYKHKREVSSDKITRLFFAMGPLT